MSTNNLPERLREMADYLPSAISQDEARTLREAADELDAKDAEIERLREDNKGQEHVIHDMDSEIERLKAQIQRARESRTLEEAWLAIAGDLS